MLVVHRVLRLLDIKTTFPCNARVSYDSRVFGHVTCWVGTVSFSQCHRLRTENNCVSVHHTSHRYFQVTVCTLLCVFGSPPLLLHATESYSSQQAPLFTGSSSVLKPGSGVPSSAAEAAWSRCVVDGYEGGGEVLSLDDTSSTAECQSRWTVSLRSLHQIGFCNSK